MRLARHTFFALPEAVLLCCAGELLEIPSPFLKASSRSEPDSVSLELEVSLDSQSSCLPTGAEKITAPETTELEGCTTERETVVSVRGMNVVVRGRPLGVGVVLVVASLGSNWGMSADIHMASVALERGLARRVD